MIESDVPPAERSREKSPGQLAGPRRGGADSPFPHCALAKFHAPEIVFGPGALAELGHCAGRLVPRRPFLVTDPGLIEAGWVDEALAYLRQHGLRATAWHDVTPNPKDSEINAGFERYAECGGDVIIGLGGGSCIDAAKGVAILSGNGGRILGYEGVDKVARPIPPTVMVPSTSGTGADVSQFAVVTDTAACIKITIISRTLVPEISVIDPRLLTTMPDWLHAASGLDALTHAIEAFVSRAHNLLTDHYALNAVRLITKHLLPAQLRPNDAGPRLAMAQGSLEAGMAFTNAILGATHAMSHQVGGLLDLPARRAERRAAAPCHQVQRAGRAGRFVPLAAAGGVRIEGVPAGEVALLLAERVRGLADEVGVPNRLAALVSARTCSLRLARTTLQDACLATNPREASAGDMRRYLRAAL